MPATHHLAQANVARMRAPIDDPLMASFVAQLDAINALAERSPGFVWRLQSDGGDATDIRAFEDPMLLINMSLWESVEALHDYVYRSDHVGLLRARRDWFVPNDGPVLVLWWVQAGELPTPEQAVEKLALLQANGPTPEAFTFRHRFGPVETATPA